MMIIIMSHFLIYPPPIRCRWLFENPPDQGGRKKPVGSTSPELTIQVVREPIPIVTVTRVHN